eukprot:jgi/Hompol1/5852/HPOL_001023-RA
MTESTNPERRGPQNVNMAVVLVLALLAACVRFYNIAHPPEIVFDETHFGGFASRYINSEFFMDVHPPHLADLIHAFVFESRLAGLGFMLLPDQLGKLLIAASGVLTGYNGSFSFKNIGLSYVEGEVHNVPYVAMRSLPAFMGSMLSPIAYTTMRNLGFSTPTSILTGVLVMLENSFACQFRLILLDSSLVFFTALTAMLWTEFRRAYDRPFTPLWWRTLVFTGISLGLTLSVKWVGLFTVALIGVATLQDLWQLVTDGSIPIPVFGRHFGARAIALIMIPLSVYAFWFQVHFAILTKQSSGSGFMSPEFQSTLVGAHVSDTYAGMILHLVYCSAFDFHSKDGYIAYGSKIAIRHELTHGGYLHSHPHDYPGGSKQQQITCYPFRDSNSWFTVKKPIGYANGTEIDPPIEGFERLKHGDTIRLDHVATNKRLHSHNVRPITKDEKDFNEVSGYGDVGVVGDTNDHWVVEILGKNDRTLPIVAITTRVRFRHQNTGCYLMSRSHKLPEWGFGQQEVTCSAVGRKKLTVWRIEFNEHPNMPPGSRMVNYQKPGFLSKLFELHQVMWNLNNGLTGSHPYDSHPGMSSACPVTVDLCTNAWPLLRRGISFWTSKTEGTFIYLLGNPAIWWSSFGAIVAFGAYGSIAAIAAKRQFAFVNLGIASRDAELLFVAVVVIGFLKEAVSAAWFFFMGWFLHYFPFFLMGRQLFLHHYLPALYFAILLLGVMFEVVTLKLRRYGQVVAALLCGLFALWIFWKFAFLTYGFVIPREQCMALKWRHHWDFGCERREYLLPLNSLLLRI